MARSPRWVRSISKLTGRPSKSAPAFCGKSVRCTNTSPELSLFAPRRHRSLVRHNDRHSVTAHAWRIQTLIYGRDRMRPLTIEAAIDEIIMPEGMFHAG
jgi:hypothetical protein